MIYTAYGLSIRSEIELPELLPAPEHNKNSAIDVQITLRSVPKSGLADNVEGPGWFQASPDALWLDIEEVARFLISDGQQIIIDPYHGADEESIRLFLLGSAFGAILFQRGHFVLHGNAIRVGNQCMVCIGDSGAGKSTLAAGFMQRGYSILSDDVVALDDEYRVLPGFPRIKLWKDTANHLMIDTAPLNRIRPGDEKYNYPLDEQFQTAPLPIRWIYLLDPDDNHTISLEPITGMKRFEPLYTNTYRVGYLEEMKLQAWQLAKCGQLSNRIRLTKIKRAKDGFELKGLITAILDDIGRNP